MAQNYVLLERIELNANATSVTFTNIPQTGYTDLVLKIAARTTRADIVDAAVLRFNGDNVTGNYSGKRILGTGSVAVSDATYSGGLTTAANATASTFGNSEVYIPNSFGSTQKSFSVDSTQETNATGAITGLQANLWNGTASISSISLYPEVGPNFVQYSTFSLYGIANASTTPTIAPKADGGNVIATDGTYWYHAFTSNGTFTPQVGLSADVLVVAGGGGGSFGGGGAGGVLYSASQSLSSSTGYTCTIGSGGIGGSFGITATSGVNSTFSSLTAIGGGYGGGANANNTAAANGGSGGGSGHGTSTGGVVVNDYGTGTSGQGNRGGSGYSDPYYTGGGGGGAGSNGYNSTTSTGGKGGDGTNSYSSWLSSIALGVSGYIAGGGGGAYSGAAGSGGGGAGGTYPSVTNGGAGTINTGSGGGGANRAGSGTGSAGAGGSGIIIIRYAVA